MSREGDGSRSSSSDSHSTMSEASGGATIRRKKRKPGTPHCNADLH